MNKKIIFPLLWMIFIFPFVVSADRFYINPVNLEVGKTETLQFFLENSNDCYGFQAEIKLPTGIEAIKRDNGELNITLSNRVDKRDYQVSSNVLPSGILIMGAFSASHKPISGKSGVLVNLEVSVTDKFEGGNLEILNAMFIDSQDNDVDLNSSSTPLGIIVTDISLNKSSLSLTEGDEETLTAEVLPKNATDKSITWSSSDDNIATVSVTGEVTAVNAGTATITASSSNGKTATCTVTVVAKVIEATGMTLNKPVVELKVGETETLTATVTPDNTTDKTITWTSSAESVATVDANGKITAKALGETTITATCGTATATCKVTVIPTPVESVTLSNTSLSLTEGGTATLTATVAPENATDKTVKWSSSDESVATVSDDGIVTAVKAGTATITATCSNGKTATSTVTIAARIIEAAGITLSQTSAELKVGDTVTLTATVLPENTTDKTVTWKSSDETVATVDAKGKITAKALGETTITATCGTAAATCKVTVIPTPVESVTLSQTELSLTEGETATLTATVAPENATDKTITWSSSDDNISTVSATGVVTAIKTGTATITASSSNGKTATCAVTVAANIISVESIAISKTELSLTEGETAILTATVAPADATDKSITWTSSDKSVVTVSDEGVVTAVKAGTATITATSSNGKTATCTVTVAAKVIEATGVTLSKTSLSLTEGETATLTATVAPENATDKTVTWTSSDQSVATVSAEGVVTAVKAGTAIITASSSNGKTTTCTVTVAAKVIKVTGVTLNNPAVELKVGETEPLTATVAPDNATDKSISWSSSDESVATVDANGKITAKAIGETTITATCGTVTATCRVTVIPTPVENVTLSKTSLSLTEGEAATLTATVVPSDATDKSITWTSSDENIATVSATGEVTAVKAGFATITASSSNGKTATCAVTVAANIIPVIRISISKSELSMTEGEKETLAATVLPENATDKTIAWTSNNESVATVSATGEVTAVKAGFATITASSSNGKTATCTVTVAAKVIESTGVTLSETAVELKVGETETLTATVAPDNTTDKTITWISSDESVATIDVNGKITAKAIGETTITATCGTATATCTVTVIPTPVESITLSNSTLGLTEGEKANLTATVVPSDATDKTIAWTSSDENIATVSATGEVTAIKAGTATITASSSNGNTATCTVTVAKKVIEVSGITLSKTELSLTEGETSTLTATVVPSDATDKKITWTSSDQSIATVSATGEVTAVKAGTATITATSSNGKTATCTVTVAARQPEVPEVIIAESLTITPDIWSIHEGNTFTIKATVLPENTSDKSLNFESSDPTVASVDEAGNVKLLKNGYCKIIVSTLDGSNLTAECVITSQSGIESIFVDPETEVDVYDMNGILLKRKCSRNELKTLKPAVYILSSGNTIVKVALK